MPPTSAAMELKVLISVLQQGNMLGNMLNQVNQLSQGLTSLQQRVNAAMGAGGNTSAAATAAQGLASASQAAARGINTAGNAAKQSAKDILTLEQALNKVWTAAKFVAGGFLALQSVRFLQDLANVAARTEVLGTVLHVVARNAGYTTDEIDKVDKSIQRLGITAQSSRQSLTQMLQAGLDIKFAERLARASQDLAVISGMDSSQTLQRMVLNIQQLDTLGLRWMGIVVNRTEAEREYARSINKTADALTQRQRVEALAQGVLKKSEELAGTYEAAMGDVGKQISSLTRYILEAKDAWGTALLPTMRAIVSEFTLFLQHMTTLGREFSANRSLAESFADVIRVIARAVRLAAEALIEHYDMIMLVVKAWLTWKAINLLVPLVAFMRWVIAMGPILVAYVYATDAASAANARFAASLALIQNIGIVYLLTVLANAVVLLAEAMERANKAWEEGKFWQFISAKDTRPLGEKFEEVLSPLTGAAARKTMESLQSRLDLVMRGEGGEAARRRWAPTAPDIDKRYADVSDEISARRKALNAATDAVRAAEERYAEALRSGSQAELDASKVALQQAKDVRKAENELFDEILSRKETDPKRREAELLFQARRKEYLELEQLSKDVAAAEERLFKGKVAISPEGKVTSPQADQMLNDVRTLMDVFDRRVKAIGDMMASSRRGAVTPSKNVEDFINQNANIITRVRESLRIALTTGNLPGDLEGFLKVLERFRKETSTPADLRLVRNLEALVRLQIRSKSQSEFAQVRAEQARVTKDQQDASVQAVENSLNLQKTANQKAELLDKDRYDRGLMSLEEYYENRLARTKQENELEADLQEARIKEIEAARPTTLPQDIPALENRLQEAQNRLEQIRKTGEVQEQQVIIEQNNARIALDRQILDLRLKTAATYGSEAASVDQITEKYKRLQEQLKAVAAEQGRQVDPKVRTALEEAERQELETFYARQRETQAKADLDHEASLRRELEIRRQLIDAAEAIVDMDLKAGRISEATAIRRRNEIAIQRVTANLEEWESLRNTLQIQRQRAETEPERRRRELEASEAFKTGKLTPEEVERQVQAMHDALRGEAQATEKQMIALSLSIKQLMDSMDSYGKRLAQNFKEGFANAITESIMDFKKAGDAWINLAQSISRQIVSIFAQAFTQRLFRNLGIFNWVDRIMGTSSTVLPSRAVGTGMAPLSPGVTPGLAEGGVVSGPGTGTSDSIPAMVSAGEHIMPAAQTARFLPLLESIRTGKILPFHTGGVVQSIAIAPIIPRHYAGGGVVTSDAGAASVTPGATNGNMTVQLHPETMNMTMREWLEHEATRQYARR